MHWTGKMHWSDTLKTSAQSIFFGLCQGDFITISSKKIETRSWPRWHHHCTRLPQETFRKIAPKLPKKGPRCLQVGPRWRQDGPKRAQDGPKMGQDSPKMAPKWPKWPKMRPNSDQKSICTSICWKNPKTLKNQWKINDFRGSLARFLHQNSSFGENFGQDAAKMAQDNAKMA